jgi:YVTN family beta-propeller protein
MCLNSRGDMLYLADAAGDAVVPVDCRSRKALPAIPLEGNPQSGEQCYLHASDSDTIICVSTGGYASRIDGHSGSLIQKKQMDTYVCFACYNPIDNRLYMTTGADVKVADCSTFNIVASIEVAKRHADPRQPPVSFGVKAACLDDRRNMMYVADEIGRSVVAIACKKESVVGSVPAGRITWSLCVNTRDGKVYYASYNDSTITVVSVGAGSTLAKIATDRVPHALLYNPKENRLYCANEGGNSVTVVDCRTERVVQTIPVGRRPVALLWSPADKRTYVLNRGASSVSVLTSAH